MTLRTLTVAAILTVLTFQVLASCARAHVLAMQEDERVIE